MSANSPVRAAVPLIPSPKRESGYCVGPAAQLIARDIGEIHSRLLDHRPVIQGETRYFIKEFEYDAFVRPLRTGGRLMLKIYHAEKRGHRETRVLENVNISISETNDQVLPRCSSVMQNQFGLVLKSLQTANQSIDRLQQREQENEKSNPSPKVRLEKLRSQWEAFMKEDERQRLAIDEEQNKAVLRLKEQYAQMDKELSKMAPF